MLTTSSPATIAPDNTLREPQPIVIVCGPTASGKSTIASNLAEVAELEQPPTTSNDDRGPGTSDDTRLADLTLLRWLADRDRPAIVKSASIPRLLAVDNTALIVQLTASPPVRARRLQKRWPNSTYAEARHLLELTDATTCTELRSSWGIDISESRGNRWRADLVIGCPQVRTCDDERACTETVTDLLTAAYGIYENYVTANPAIEGPDALELFAHLRHTYPRYVRRLRPALVGPVREFTADAWRNRTLGELDARSGLV